MKAHSFPARLAKLPIHPAGWHSQRGPEKQLENLGDQAGRAGRAGGQGGKQFHESSAWPRGPPPQVNLPSCSAARISRPHAKHPQRRRYRTHTKTQARGCGGGRAREVSEQADLRSRGMMGPPCCCGATSGHATCWARRPRRKL